MANTVSQAQQIKELLIEKIEAYDPTLNTGEGSAFYSQVVEPVFAAMGTDPFDTDIEEFLLTRLRQEFPSIPAEQGDAVVDLLIRPLQLLLESFKRELQIIRRGQSTNYADLMRVKDAEDLAANFFVTRRVGSRASGIARVYFRQPTFVSILATTEFRTSDGLSFFPTVPQFFRPEVVAVQRSGDLYYVDVAVLAEDFGEEYNIAAQSISSVGGLRGVARVTNQFEFGGGNDEETGQELLTRTRASLTERSLVTRRGIRARLFDEFTAIRNMEVVGYGDPEMQRDRVTGGGGMDNVCSGMCFIVGRYAMLFSMFEDRGLDGDRFIKEGSVLDLNFWKFLYEPTREKAMQRFTVETVIYNSHGDLENIPTVYLLKLDDAPDMDAPVASALPGVLPGVFFTAYAPATITISDIPGGITNPDDEGRILVEDGAIHIGGHYDVYLRPSQSNVASSTVSIERSEVSLIEGTELVTNGEIPTELANLGALKNKVHSRLRLTIVVSSGAFSEGELVRKQAASSSTPEEDTTALLHNYDLSDSICDLACLTADTEWEVGDYILGLTTGAVGIITKVDSVVWSDLGVTRGMTLNIVNGSDAGIYKILDVRGVELILDLELTTLGSGFQFRITDETVFDAFDPKSQVFPFGEATANDLNTVIGTSTVRVDNDLSLYGVKEGDTIEILYGNNKGTYSIQGFDPVFGARAPILDRVLRSTDSDLEYVIYRPTTGLNLPLIRVLPNGMSALDTAGQSSGFTIPPSEPVGARAYSAFSGARASYLGLNGFILPDPGPTWMPNGNTVVDEDSLDPTTLAYIEQYYGSPKACYSEECLEYEDAFIAVINIIDNPASSTGHDPRVYLDIDLPTEATEFLQNLRAWLTSVVESFELGDDFRSLVDLFAPISLDTIPTGWNIIAQYEILVPKEIFDGCNNVFVAIPEYNWKNEFGNDITFQDAMDKYNNGELKGGKPALTKAAPGGALTILSGANAGSYVISKVYRYSLVNGGSIQTADTATTSDDYIDKNKMFEIVLVCIDDSFPVEPFKDLGQYFDAARSGALSLPAPPVFNVQSMVRTGPDAGTVLGPWEVVQQAVTWLFQFLNSTGFDLPEEFTVTPDSVLKKLTQTFFVDYVVGNTTCEQMVRMSFLEPTSVTAYGNRPCFNYTWYETETAPASITGGAVTLPLAGLSGAELIFSLSTLGARKTISATLSAALSEEEDPATFVSLLQDEMDADAKDLLFTYVQDGDHTLELIVSSVEEGVDVKISGDADQITDATRLLGFSESGYEFGEFTLNSGSSAYAPRQITARGAQTPFMYFRSYGTIQARVFSGGISDIGSPAVGDTVTSVASPFPTATILAILTSVPDNKVILLLDSLLSYPDDITISGTDYTAIANNNFPSSFSLAQIGYSEVDGEINPGATSTLTTASGLASGIYATRSAFILPSCTTAAEIEAGVSAFNDALASEIDSLVKDCILEAMHALGHFSAWTVGDASYEVQLSSLVSVSAAVSVDGTDLKLTLSSSLPTLVDKVQINNDIATTPGAEFYSTPVTLSLASPDHESVLEDLTQFSFYGTVEGFSSTEDWGGSYVPASIEALDDLVSNLSLLDDSGLYDVESIAQFLNAHATIPFRDSDGTTREVLFYAPLGNNDEFLEVGGSKTVGIRALAATTFSSVTLGAVSIADVTAVAINSVDHPILGVGTSSTGESHTEYVHPTAPTLFSAEAGTAELLFVATGSEAPFQVFPGETATGKVIPLDLYRDLNISSHFVGAKGFTATFNDLGYASPLLAGVQRGTDILKIYEQRTLLEVAGSGAEALPEKFDRVVAATTTFGSAVIKLPVLTTGASHEFGFLSASSDLEQDEIVPGDLLFIEEGDDKRGYIVQSVSDTEITLNRLLTETTAQIYQAGNEGVIDQGTAFYDTQAAFTADDVGRYLTIYLSNYEGVDGSYQITSVTDSFTVELDISAGNFPVSETGVHWAVVKAPIDDLEESEISGATALHGVIPFRVYNSTPTEWRISNFHPTVDRGSSNLSCIYEGAEYPSDNPHTRDLTNGPIRGYKQPYEIVRENVVHISSTAMKAQGRDNGLYYFDVRAKSLGGDSVFNVPKDTHMTPIFGTYDSDGYRFEVNDPLFSFSMKETNTKIHIGSRFLPADLNDVEENKISVEGITLDIEHDYSSLVAGVQSVLLSAENRVLCADPLARHFLPSYVYFDVTATGGSDAGMGQAIADHINGLEPEAVIDISVLEKYLHENNVTTYRHPLTVQIVTHDLDRKPVLTRSHDRIGGESDEAAFNGSHRTTFYIPGEVTTAAVEADIPDGERIYIKRSE